MIKLLISEPGSGKTKDMIKHANSALETARGNIVFVGESSECILKINHDIRFINISEYPLESSNEIIGFLHGLISSNYDIESIYLDGLANIYIMSAQEICDWLERIKWISDKHNIRFEISVSFEGDVPDCFNPYLG